MTAAPRLRIVCPVFLDVECFLVLRREILSVLAQSPAAHFEHIDFVVLDDSAGQDPQIETLRGLADVEVIEPPFNLGHQRGLVFALRTLAARIADTDFVVTLDADGQDRPEDLPRLLAPLLDAPDDVRRVALARRTKRRESIPFKILYFFFRVLFRALCGVVVRSGNFAAYRGWFARRLIVHPHFDLCYSSSFISLNLPIAFVPIERGERYSGRSRMSYDVLIMHGVRMLLPFTDRIAIRSLIAVFAIIGASTSALIAISALAFDGRETPLWVSTALIVGLIAAIVALGNLVLLFAAFVQTRSISLRHLEREYDGRPGSSRSSTD